MAQVSAPPGSVPLPSDEPNDDPFTPTSARWTDDRAPLRTTSPEPLQPSPPPKWKGKQREILPTHDDEPVSSDVREVDLGRTSVEQEIHEAPTESLVATTYPPAPEEAIEERKVNEVCSWCSRCFVTDVWLLAHLRTTFLATFSSSYFHWNDTRR